jgi:hypothetical protein
MAYSGATSSRHEQQEQKLLDAKAEENNAVKKKQKAKTEFNKTIEKVSEKNRQAAQALEQKIQDNQAAVAEIEKALLALADQQPELKADLVELIVLLRQSNTKSYEILSAILKDSNKERVLTLVPQDNIAAQPGAADRNMEKQLAEAQTKISQTVALAGLYSAALDRVIASGFIPAISKYVDIVIQSYKSLARVEEEKQTQLRKEFEDAVLSLPAKLINGKVELWKYLLAEGELMYYPRPPRNLAALPEYYTGKRDLQEQVNARKLSRPEAKLNMLETFWEGLLSGLDKDLQDTLKTRQAELEKQEISREKKQIANINNAGQLAGLLNQKGGSLPDEVRQEILKRLKELLQDMTGNLKPEDKGALEDIANNMAVPQNIRNLAEDLLDKLEQQSEKAAPAPAAA